MKIPYTFSVLRYVHDTATEEFVNIGVALYSPQARFLRARCTARYGCITEFFNRIDGERFRQLTRYIEQEVQALGMRLEQCLPLEPAGEPLPRLLARVLPEDDSGLQFSPAGAGLTDDLAAELASLFTRFVDRYAEHPELSSRNDEEVWRTFRTPLERAGIIDELVSKRIVAPNFDYEFRRAWKNEKWHVYEPLSFDMVEAPSILDKANRWLGRGINLLKSSEPFQLHFLLGAPQDTRLNGAFEKAKNILSEIPTRPTLIEESDAEEFASELEREIGAH